MTWITAKALEFKLYIAGAFALLIAVWRIYAAGQRSEVAKQDADSLDNLRKRNEVENEVRNDVNPRVRLARWVRKK